MKKNIIIILLVAIIALGGFWIWKNQNKKAEKPDNNEIKQEEQKNQIKEPEEVVREFYKIFSDIKLYSPDIVPTEEILDGQEIKEYIDDSFKDYYIKYNKEYCKGIISCASVISCTQDYPKDFSIGNIEKNGKTAKIEVFNKFPGNYGDENKKPITFELVLRNDGWKITKTICPSLK